MATDYPIPVFFFEVDWGGTRIGFTEVSGLSVETQPIDYRDGLSKEYVMAKIPGMQSYSSLTFKRGIFKGDNELYDWWNSVSQNTIEKRDITITLLDETASPVVTWSVKNAWASKIDGPGLNSTSNEVAIETMEVVHEGLTISIS